MTDSHNDQDERVIIHFDLDAFYVACERELNPELRGVPLGVSQYNPYGNLQETSPNDIHRRLVRTPHNNSNSNNNNNNSTEDTNGSLIAVSYEARAAGVRRNDRGMEAIRKCPSLYIVVVPVKHGKSDIGMYRRASKRVMQVLMNVILQEKRDDDDDDDDSDIPVEVASIDEVYVNVTRPVDNMTKRIMENDALWKECIQEACNCTTVGGIEVLSNAAEAANALDKTDVRKGSRLQILDSHQDEGSRAWWNRPKSEWSRVEIRLACGALLAAKARRAVVEAFPGGVFTLSAGISSNKTLAKLASGLKKPNRQTLINPTDPTPLEKLFYPLPLSRIRGLGGKFGMQISQTFGITTVGQLSQVPLTTLQSQLEVKTARFLYDIARGICRDPVTPRTRPKSIASSKNFRGQMAIPSSDTEKLTKWVGELCNELTERLEADGQEYNRNASTLVLAVATSEEASSVSKQCRAPRKLNQYNETALQLIQQLVEAAKSRLQVDKVTITHMSISATQFVDHAAGSASIVAAFERSASKNDDGKKKTISPLRARSPMNMQSRKTKSSIMDNWLSSDRKKTSGTKRSVGDAESSSATKIQARLPTMDEIDPLVLKELPEELRVSLMKDIARAHPTKKTNVIQNFLRRSGESSD